MCEMCWVNNPYVIFCVPGNLGQQLIEGVLADEVGRDPEIR